MINLFAVVLCSLAAGSSVVLGNYGLAIVNILFILINGYVVLELIEGKK